MQPPSPHTPFNEHSKSVVHGAVPEVTIDGEKRASARRERRVRDSWYHILELLQTLKRVHTVEKK
jgi:hypothetical protein